MDKDAYFAEYKAIIKNNKKVYCPPLQDEVELRRRTGEHILNRGDYKTKFPLLKHLPQMVKTAFDKKPMTVVGKRNIKEAYRVFTNVQIDGKNRVAGMIVFKDNNNRFVYDMYINEKNKIGKGVTLPSGVASNDADNPAPVTPLDKDNNQTDSLSQEFFADDDVMLDSTGSKMVLNLFIFDENGNEIDDLPQDEPQPAENPQNNDIDDNQGTSEPKNNTDKLKDEPKYEYRPHGKDLTFLGQEFDHTPTGDNYTVWGVAKGKERWGVVIAVETVNMGKKITTKELAQKVADVMAQRFGYAQLEIRSDRAFLGGGVSAISNAFGAGGLTKPAQENKNQDTQAELTKQMNEPNETDSNLDYLTDMANGKIELTVQNMKEHILKLKEIAVALDGKHDDLLNQAIEVYQEFALSVKVQ